MGMSLGLVLMVLGAALIAGGITVGARRVFQGVRVIHDAARGCAPYQGFPGRVLMNAFMRFGGWVWGAAVATGVGAMSFLGGLPRFAADAGVPFILALDSPENEWDSFGMAAWFLLLVFLLFALSFAVGGLVYLLGERALSRAIDPYLGALESSAGQELRRLSGIVREALEQNEEAPEGGLLRAALVSMGLLPSRVHEDRYPVSGQDNDRARREEELRRVEADELWASTRPYRGLPESVAAFQELTKQWGLKVPGLDDWEDSPDRIREALTEAAPRRWKAPSPSA